VTGTVKQGAGEATKAAKEHFWTNHFSADLDPLLASRENLIKQLDRLSSEIEKLQKTEAQLQVSIRSNRAAFPGIDDPQNPPHPHLVRLSDVLNSLRNIYLNPAKSAVMEAKIMNDLALPKKYRDELEKRFGKQVDE
jgi:hypothetical protein